MLSIFINTQVPFADCEGKFGIFYEDLNHAADGGLYGELVQNRSFEFSGEDCPGYDALTGWEEARICPFSRRLPDSCRIYARRRSFFCFSMEKHNPSSGTAPCQKKFNLGI